MADSIKANIDFLRKKRGSELRNEICKIFNDILDQQEYKFDQIRKEITERVEEEISDTE